MPILNKVDFLSNPSHEKNARRFLENDPLIVDFLGEGRDCSERNTKNIEKLIIKYRVLRSKHPPQIRPEYEILITTC